MLATGRWLMASQRGSGETEPSFAPVAGSEDDKNPETAEEKQKRVQKERASDVGITLANEYGNRGTTFEYGGDSTYPKRQFVVSRIARFKGKYVLVLRDQERFKGPEYYAVYKRGPDGRMNFDAVRDPSTQEPIDPYATEKYKYMTQYFKK